LIKRQQEKAQDTKSTSRQVKQLERYADKLAKYEEQEALLKGRNSYSKTDPDATYMRMKDDQLYAGYNIIQGTEDQFILNYSIHQTPGETHFFIPHMERLEKHAGKIPQRIVGDAAYGSEENYHWINKNNVGNYLKYSSFHREGTKKYKQNPFLKDNFPYDAKNDSFTCPQGKKLRYKFTAPSRSKTGYNVYARHYESEGCQGCQVADLCKRSAGNRKIKISPNYEQYKKQARDNLTSPPGVKLRKKRSVDVETAFGNIKYNQKFTRFHLRGVEKVNIEWGLVSIAHNIRKMVNGSH